MGVDSSDSEGHSEGEGVSSNSKLLLYVTFQHILVTLYGFWYGLSRHCRFQKPASKDILYPIHHMIEMFNFLCSRICNNTAHSKDIVILVKTLQSLGKYNLAEAAGR